MAVPSSNVSGAVVRSGAVATSLVLGEMLDAVSPSPVTTEAGKKSTNYSSSIIVGLIFLGLGIIFSGIAGYLVFRKISNKKLI